MKKHGFYVKALSVMLLLTIILMSFVGCSSSKVKPIKPSEQDLKVVGNVMTVEILFEELRYLTILSKETIENKYNISLWDNEALTAQYKDELKETVIKQLTANAAVVLMAYELFGADQANMDYEEMKVKIQESMEAFITTSFYLGEKYIIDNSGKQVKYNAIDAYKQWLSDTFMTDHLVRYNIFIGLLETQLLNEYSSDNLSRIPTDTDSVYNAIMDNKKFARVKMIFIENDLGEDVDKNRAKAEEVRGKIADGESFDSYLSLSEDFSDPEKNFYYMPHKGSSYGETVSQAAIALKNGELSQVIETSNGFYILQRIEKDTAKVLADISIGGELYNAYLWAEFYAIVDEFQDTLEFKFNDYGNSLDLAAIK